MKKPTGARVLVEVEVRPEQAGSGARKAAPESVPGSRPAREIDPVDPLTALHQTLADLTRTASAGSTIDAYCMEARLSKLLKNLGASEIPKEPIDVTLPADA